MTSETKQGIPMKRISKSILVMALTGTATFAQAAELDITITNATHGVFFAPLLVSAHSAEYKVFTTGSAASSGLQAMAEGGSIAGISDALSGIGATLVENPAEGILKPGASVTTSLNTDNAAGNQYLSVVAMMLPTNDGFVGLSSWKIPTEPGTYKIALNAYDAGTEANDEILGSGVSGEAGFPAPPVVAATTGTGGTGVESRAEGFVHVHRGVSGDADATGGSSDMTFAHRWLNPVAQVIVTVK